MEAETIRPDEPGVFKRVKNWLRYDVWEPTRKAALAEMNQRLVDQHTVVGLAVGKFTLGLADVPVTFFSKRYARADLENKLSKKGLSVTDLSTKAEPLWRLTDKKGGTTFINPDNVTEGTYARDFGDLYASAVGIKVNPEMRMAYDIAKFVGAVKPMYKINQAITGNIPLHPFAVRRITDAMTGIELSLLMQVEDKLAEKRDGISFADAAKTGGWFTFLGGTFDSIQMARGAIADARIIREYFKANPAIKNMLSAEDLKCISKSGRSAVMGANRKWWHKTYGDRLYKIGGKLDKYNEAIKWKPKIQKLLPEGTAPKAGAAVEVTSPAIGKGIVSGSQQTNAFAVKLRDGRVLAGPDWYAHGDSVNSLAQAGIAADNIVESGFINSKGLYVEADTPKTLLAEKQTRDRLGRFIKKIPPDTPLPVPKGKYSVLIKAANRAIQTELRRDTIVDAETMATLSTKQPWEPTHVTVEGDIISDAMWRKTFREPGLAVYFTPKEYYLRLLGFDDMIKPITNATKMMYLEQIEVNNWARGIEKRINKLASTSPKEKFVSKLLNKSTNPVQKMAVLTNQYADAPPFMRPEDAKIFTEIRSFTRDLLTRCNATRTKLGLEPIKEVKAYMTHWLDNVARQAVSKKYPFPHEVEYWIGRRIPKRVYNPLAEQRKVRDELLEHFSKNLGQLLSVMARYELRDIYLSEPYSILKAQLDEMKKIIPAGARNELDAYLRHDIFGYQTDLDKIINTTLSPAMAVINPPIALLNRTTTNPVRVLSRGIRRVIMDATIWGRARLAIRNLGQKLLIMDIYPQTDYLRAQFWKDTPGLMDKLRQELYYKISRRRWEDLPTGTMIERAGMMPYQKAHAGFNYLSNVDVAMKTGYYYGQRMLKLSADTNSSFYKTCARRFVKSMPEKVRETAAKQIVARKGSLYDAFKKKLWTPEDALQEATEAGSLTQWTYFITDMPRVFRGHASRAFMTLQSWWQNYFFKHMREGMIRTFSGETSKGKYIRPVDRINYLKGTTTILGLTEGVRLATGLDYKRFYFGVGPAPVYLSPLGQVMIGSIRYLTAKSDAQRSRAMYQMKYSYKAFVPGSMAWKDLSRFLRGEDDLKQFLFYTEDVVVDEAEDRTSRVTEVGEVKGVESIK